MRGADGKESRTTMADTKDQNTGELFQTHIGGAAMLEGVMMRGRYSWAVAVREPEGGIYVEEHDVPGYGKKQPWRKWPLVRGCIAMVESLVLQYKAMGITAAHAYDFDEDEEQAKKLEGKSEAEKQAARAEAAEQIAEEQRQFDAWRAAN